MLHIPLLRKGTLYTSLEQKPLQDHRTGEVLAEISQAHSGLISRDRGKKNRGREMLQALTVKECIAYCQRAANIFMQEALPLGEGTQSPAEFVSMQSATTGLPETLVQRNMQKLEHVLGTMKKVIDGLTGGIEHKSLEHGLEGECLGAVLPNNSPGVNALWLPALALRVPVALKPGHQDPWTPWRLIQSLIKAGFPAEAFSYYPCDHGSATTLLSRTSHGMIFGDASTTSMWEERATIERHGPGFSKILLDDEAAEQWDQYGSTMLASVVENSGRSCVNASCIITTSNGRAIAEHLAEQMAQIQPVLLEDPKAALAAFPDHAVAAAINNTIEEELKVPGATDMTAVHRKGERLVTHKGSTFLQPTVIWCEDSQHALAHKEYLFPYVAVVEVPMHEWSNYIDKGLVVTALTNDGDLQQALTQHPGISNLNLTDIPTCRVNWHKPHEGNLFALLSNRRGVHLPEEPSRASV